MSYRGQKFIYKVFTTLFFMLLISYLLNPALPYGSSDLRDEKFIDAVFQYINEERSFKGLLPLVKDDIAMKVASEQASDLIERGNLSYYSTKNQPPDERYTQAGGTGALIEIVNGFEKFEGQDAKDAKNQKIKLTDKLAYQLAQATALNSDNSQVLFNPYITHLGLGYALSKDARKFVAVIEFLTKAGEFEPLKPVLNFGEKILIAGMVNLPYKFKAVSVGYFNESISIDEDENSSVGFNSENLKPYFPPQDYIAYSDNLKVNFIKVVKGLGVIGAIAGAPFTGGATAILAPVLLSSIQNGQPKEIPLKSGIKANSKSEFYGKIDLNYQGMSGLYFISVLAELPSVNYPIIVSRRTVRVNNPLVPIGELEDWRLEDWRIGGLGDWRIGGL